MVREGKKVATLELANKDGGIVELISLVEVGKALRKGPESAGVGRSRPSKDGP